MSLFMISCQVMDDYWNSQVLEFGAVNITGFRILQPSSLEFRTFFNSWKSLDSHRWPDPSKTQISVSVEPGTPLSSLIFYASFFLSLFLSHHFSSPSFVPIERHKTHLHLKAEAALVSIRFCW